MGGEPETGMVKPGAIITITLACGAALLLGQIRPAALPEAPDFRSAGWKPLLNDKDLSGWRIVANRPAAAAPVTEWFKTSAVALSTESPAALSAVAAPGPIAVNGTKTRTSHLVTEEMFGDVELYIEWMVSKNSNSGVYLHGLYEVQILDSFGKDNVGSGDAGGIYERWANNQGYEGSAPSLNASRPPGEWQSFHIWFKAPRFADGKKVANAEFVKVLHNGKLVQSGYQCSGPTRSALEIPEAPRNPLMLQGDHGPVAYRNIYIRPLR